MVVTPGQPDDPHQPRPALVVSEDVRNRLRDDLIVIPVFSSGKVGPTRVSLPTGAGGLRRAGVLFCEEITTIDRDFLHRGPLGPRLPSSVLDAVVRAVRRALGDVIIGA
ncbi:MAG: type II toxin-antitoxin system PemK/MazF family toxin [Candidatus Dormibacteraeota bacterium]|nr:type II toxin-antitoxin system PemK/MazF family toxin [Candidatus Dormibacteraeota bacterium]